MKWWNCSLLLAQISFYFLALPTPLIGTSPIFFPYARAVETSSSAFFDKRDWMNYSCFTPTYTFGPVMEQRMYESETVWWSPEMYLLNVIQVDIRVMRELVPFAVPMISSDDVKLSNITEILLNHTVVPILIQVLIKFHLIQDQYLFGFFNQELESSRIAICCEAKVDFVSQKFFVEDHICIWTRTKGKKGDMHQWHIGFTTDCNTRSCWIWHHYLPLF